MRLNPLLFLRRGGVFEYSIDFSTLGDGPLPDDFETNAAWAVSSGVAVGTPVEGSELLTDGGLENWDDATHLTSWIEEIAGTSTINREDAVINGGTYSARLDIDASNSQAKIYQTPSLSIGDWFVSRAYMRATGGRANIENVNQIPSNHTGYPPVGSWLEWDATSIKDTTAGFKVAIGRHAASSQSIYIDDVSVKKLTLTSLLACVNAKTSDVTVKANWTVLTKVSAGIIMNVDDPSNPQNYVALFVDQQTGDGSAATLKLVKVVSNAVTQVASIAITYGDDDSIELRKSGTSYDVYYNGSQVGATQTISDAGIIGNGYHGLLSANGGCTCSYFFAG